MNSANHGYRCAKRSDAVIANWPERAGVELDDLQARIDQTADAVESSASKLVEAAAREARQVWGERTRNDA
jgi:hypothetical protein